MSTPTRLASEHGAVRSILGDQTFRAVDIGGAGGLPRHWRAIEHIADVYVFEPHPLSYEALRVSAERQGLSNMTIVPYGVSKDGGETTLYATNNPRGSSLLPLDVNSGAISAKNSYLYPVSEIPVSTISLSEFAETHRLPAIDLIKLDAQGAELDILAGAGVAGDSFLGIELEVTFRRMYVGQATLDRVHRYMTEHGLELFDIRAFTDKWYIGDDYRNELGERFARALAGDASPVSHQIHDADMIYFRAPAPLLAAGDLHGLRRLIVAYSVYGFFAHAAWLARELVHRGLIDRATGDAIDQAVMEWASASRPSASVRLVSSILSVLRRVRGKVDQRPPRWAPFEAR